MRTFIRRSAALVVVLALGVIASAESAHAAFPGQNGRFVSVKFVDGEGYIVTRNPDGSNETLLTPSENNTPSAWSADGTKIAFSRPDPVGNTAGIWVMNQDGTNQVRLTNGTLDRYPFWSPDGTKIGFSRFTSAFPNPEHVWVMNADGSNQTQITPTGNPNVDVSFIGARWAPDGSVIAMTGNINAPDSDIYTIRPDGTGLANLTNTPNITDFGPDWSPDSTRIAFYSDRTGDAEIFRMNRDGTAPTNLTNTPSASDTNALWAPDGQRIVYFSFRQAPSQRGLYFMNTDGAAQTFFSYDSADDWQAAAVGLPYTYVRPKAASPMHVSLVPALRKCLGPDRTHGPPLAHPSCSQPTPRSEYLTIGTPDVLIPRPANAVGSVRATVQPGDGSTTTDEADVQLVVRITDVRDKVRLSDYIGELQASMSLRLTDRLNAPGQTVTDAGIAWNIPCAVSASQGIGSTCESTTTADAITPGIVREGSRAVWELGQVEVRDGGEDGFGQTEADNTVFMKQGIFVP